MRTVTDIARVIGGPTRILCVVGAASLLLTVTAVSSAQSILVGNFLPNPDFETETRFVAHRTEGPTDNSFADAWHHDVFVGWNDLTPPAGWPPAPFDLGGTVTTEPVLSGLHSERLFDQESYYFAPGIIPGAGLFATEDVRSFSTAIPVDPNSPTGFAEKLWVRWHWNYDMTAGFDGRITFNLRTSDAPIVSLDLAGLITDHKFMTAADPNTFLSSSNGLWEEETMFIDLTGEFDPQKSLDVIIETQGTTDAIGLVWVDDISVTTIDPNSIAAPSADFDGNTEIDGDDFLIWQRGLGLTGQTDNSNGDADGDGIVGPGDLAVWESQYGGPAPLSAVAAAVPEPTAWMLWLVGMGFVGGKQRRRRWSLRKTAVVPCEVAPVFLVASRGK